MLYQLSRKLKLERKERRSGRRTEISLKYIRPNAHSASGTPVKCKRMLGVYGINERKRQMGLWDRGKAGRRL
jgi:hypothetical protein